MTVVFISLTVILAIYFIIAFSPLKVCAICSAVSMTWLGLLLTYMLGMHEEIVWLGVLMGGSVVGLMYKLDSYWKEKKYSGTWLLKLTIIVFGFLTVYVVVNTLWTDFFWLVPSMVVVSTIGVMLLRSNKEDNVSSKLQSKLDHCCD
ncbi:MAG: hypothetical protein ACPGO5_02700 [Patescibacteria group bacterium]